MPITPCLISLDRAMRQKYNMVNLTTIRRNFRLYQDLRFHSSSPAMHFDTLTSIRRLIAPVAERLT
jgi:hypothetical protein